MLKKSFCGDYPHFVETSRSVDIIRISWIYPRSADIIRILWMYPYFVEFGTNTLDSLVYFSIPVVSNHMRYLGAHVYFSTNTYQLALLVEFRKKNCSLYL